MKAIYIIVVLLIAALCVQGNPRLLDKESMEIRQHLVNFKDFFVDSVRNMATRLENKSSIFFKELTAPRIKNYNDICVWKICSRPLKYKAESDHKKEKAIKIRQPFVFKNSFSQIKSDYRNMEQKMASRIYNK